MAASSALAGPASQPTTGPMVADRPWGPSKAGVAISVVAVDAWKLTGPMRLQFALRNTGRVPVRLPGPKAFFGYLLVAQGGRAYYTERIRHARDLADWPAALKAGQVLQLPAIDAARLKVYSYQPHLRLIEGYPAELVDGRPRPRQPAGELAGVLKPGTLKVKYIAYLPRPGESALSLIGNVLKLNLGLEDFPKLPARVQRRILADLAGRFRRDAWSARAACRDAVQIGPPAVEALTAIATDRAAEAFARMWATAALAGIGGPEATKVLIRCLDSDLQGVRNVAAYHGLKMRSEQFDKALNARAATGKDGMLTAWAIMGHLKYRGQVPAKLLAAGVASEQWKARAAVAETIAGGNPNRTHLPILRRLVRDSNGMIRQTAARAIGYVGDSSYETLSALMAALEMDGESARHAVAGALCRVTGKKWFYPASGPREQKAKVLAAWQQWWKENQETFKRAGK